MTFLSRGLVNFSIAAAAAAALITLDWLYGISLNDRGYFNGLLLLGGVFLLALFNARKKLPFLPLLSASAWLQIHVNLGWLCAALFFVHTKFKLPDGAFEVVLWWMFVIVAGSGVAGLIFSRTFPARLMDKGERVIFERIPQHRRRLADRVEELALRSVSETSSSSIADYYAARLRHFMRAPRNVTAHLFESNAAYVRMRGEMLSLKRYLDQRNQAILDEIIEHAEAKNLLDYQYAHQLTLKAWLFVHVPLTYSLLLLALVHTALVYAYSGGAP